MALVVGSNSWATIAEADAYLTNRIGASNWFNLSDEPSSPGEESKETFLIMAYNILLYKGGYALSSTSTGTSVIYAQSEMAFQLYVNYKSFMDRAELQNAGLSSFKLSQWEEDYASNMIGDFTLPILVSNFLTGYRFTNVSSEITVE